MPRHINIQVIIPWDESFMSDCSEARSKCCPICEICLSTNSIEIFKNVEHFVLQVGNSK